MLFMYMYLTGLVIGLGLHALTFLFKKELENKNKGLIVFVIGVLVFLASLTIIGGFAGMPYGVLSAGVMTVGLLLAVFDKRILWKKLVYTVSILFIISSLAYNFVNQNDYWIVKKTNMTAAVL